MIKMFLHTLVFLAGVQKNFDFGCRGVEKSRAYAGSRPASARLGLEASKCQVHFLLQLSIKNLIKINTFRRIVGGSTRRSNFDVFLVFLAGVQKSFDFRCRGVEKSRAYAGSRPASAGQRWPASARGTRPLG